MHPNELVAQDGRRHRRQFSNEYKAEVVASCQQRGVSVAAVARAHGQARRCRRASGGQTIGADLLDVPIGERAKR